MLRVLQDILFLDLRAYQYRLYDHEQVFQLTQLNFKSAFMLSMYIYLLVFSLQSPTELQFTY